MLRTLTLLVITCMLYSCAQKQVIHDNQAKSNLDLGQAQNIIFMVGDGMGLSQISAGMWANGNQLAIEQFKKIGFHKSYSSNDLVTDSAAGATAFSCGKKTYNGAIGVDPDTVAMYTILEEAEDNGLLTGMVTSSTIVHATPASFIAHNEARGNYEEIALDFLETEIDLFIGGGLQFFNRREDGRNLIQELEVKGYYMDNYFDTDFEKLDFSQHQKIGYLTADKNPLMVSQGRDYLPSATAQSLDFLNRRSKEEGKGFFLLIEGAQIDWGGHSNEGNYIIEEMIDFDRCIAEVLKFLDNNPNTLLVVTADHETGGLAINKGSTMDSLVMKFTSDYHTADLIPVFAKGPGSSAFMGIYENTAIYHKMRKAFGWQSKN